MAAGPASTCRVHFADLDRTLEVAAGTTVLDACEKNGVYMEAACGGFACCNTCRVRVISGGLSPVEEVEEPFLDAADQRLGCQAKIVGDVVLKLDPGA
ncbi:MAG: 2Fe-2S iron-sulfur cluster-binding protein [Myxococcota bacterium]